MSDADEPKRPRLRLISPPVRLRRAGRPRFVEHELAHKAHRYPNAIEIEGGLVRWRRSRWSVWERHEDVEPPAPIYATSEAFGWILQGRRRVGALQIVAHNGDTLSPGLVWGVADGLDELNARAVGVMISAFDDFADVFAFGPVVELRYVWVEQDVRIDWPAAVRAVALASYDDAAHLVGQVYPLEYDIPHGEHLTPASAFRSAALARLMLRRFEGLQPLPGPSGEEGWLWRPAPRLTPWRGSAVTWEPLEERFD